MIFIIVACFLQTTTSYQQLTKSLPGTCFNQKFSSLANCRNTRVTASISVDSTPSFETMENKGIMAKVKNAANIMYKFSRPHTIKGTILASIMGVTRALIENPGTLNLKLIPRAITGLTALLAGNAYIVGINQIYDVKIDEINKPDLPMAAKQLSTPKAWAIVLTCLFTGVGIVKTQFSSLIFSLYMLGTFFGTIYSVPPFTLKRFPLLAGGIIAVVRGFLLNFGVYYAVREALGVPFQWNPVVAFISSFMTVFATVIAVTKDLPDIEGDIKYNITTFASKFGAKAVSQFATVLLSSTYTIAMAIPYITPKGTFKALPMTLSHGSFLIFFLYSFSKLDTSKMSSINDFYKAIWKLFYLEYCIYPFI
jgi:homogentisate solanesyltransferase